LMIETEIRCKRFEWNLCRSVHWRILRLNAWLVQFS
jgi:hypothetical protein